MGVNAQSDLSGAAKKTPLAHGHRIGMCSCELGAWPCEVVDCRNMALD